MKFFKQNVYCRLLVMLVLIASAMATKAQNVSAIEYYFDEDPGFGNGTRVAVTPGLDVTANFQVNVSALSSGFHKLYTRAYTAPYTVTENNRQFTYGGWSLTSVRSLYKESLDFRTTPIANVVRGEYYVDNDPGFGKGASIPVTPGKDLSNVKFTFDITSLEPGFHRLYGRFQDAYGAWSHTAVKTFYKEQFSSTTNTLADVVKGEYYFDEDPGFGAGISLAVGSGKNIETSFTADISNLTAGFHRMHVRFKDAYGAWSITHQRSFYKETAPVNGAPLPDVTEVEYYVDADPGFGNGKKIPFTPGMDISNLTFEVEMTDVAVGNHRVYVRAKNAKGVWSLTSTGAFKVEHPSGFYITVGTISGTLCSGGTIAVPFTLNAPFSASNVFKVQLSNSAGSFASPFTIGTLAGNQSGTIQATLPPFATTATGYRVRIIATAPADTSAANGAALTINRVPNTFAIGGDTTTCFGPKTYTLTNPEGGSDKYVWSVSGGGTMNASGTSATINWATAGEHTITVNYRGICAGDDSVKVKKVAVVDTPLTGTIGNMLPENGNINLSHPVTFSWLPVNGATHYELYIWQKDAVKPTTPTVATITGINYTISSTSILVYEKEYNWQVMAKQACYSLESPVQAFKIRNLPDLTVTQVRVPATAFSAQSITISWDVKNGAQGATLQKQWFDKVYLSKDAIFEPATDLYLGAVANASELVYNAGYTQTASFTLPQGINDSYYAFVVTNGYEQLVEANLTNNVKMSATKTAVQLTPPPDLKVTSVIRKSVGFSGQNTDLTWTVTNDGTGGTVASTWVDYVYISKDSGVNVTDLTLLGAFPHAGALASKAFYTVTRPVKVPEGLFGGYYFYVKTDVSNNVYEHANEKNNTGISDSIHLVLTPPVDMVTTKVIVPLTASTRESVQVKWNVFNQGGSSTNEQVWLDKIYLSKDTAFNLASAIQLGNLGRSTALDPQKDYNATQNINIPSNITGDYYVYVHANYGYNVFEYTHTDNNIKRSDAPIKISVPDLTVADIAAPATDTSGTEIVIQWKTKNSGAGTVFNATIVDRILFSPTQTFNPATAVEVKQVSYNTGTLLPGAAIAKTEAIQLPPAFSGNYFIFIQTDTRNNVEEIGKEENNTGSSLTATQIVLAKWADLQVLQVATTGTANGGGQVQLNFTIINKGDKEIAGLQWNDKVYISTSETWTPANATYIRDFTQARAVGKDSAYQVSAPITLPASAGDSMYYVYVVADGKNDVYEHTDEGNNWKKSSAFFIKKYPPVDLAVKTITAPGNGSSGKPIDISWTVENKGKTATIQPQWSDALYLSADTTWNAATDIFVKDFIYKGVLTEGKTYNTTQSVVLPNGISGSLYLLMVADHTDQNKDAVPFNNYKPVLDAAGNPIRITIRLTPPSNLVVTELTIPQERPAGQPAMISWKVKNTGTGTTAAGPWTEKLYLSADAAIDQGDVLLGSFARRDSLASMQEYNDSLRVVLPVTASGNYYVILKTDASDNVYEHGAENDNSRSGFITIVRPLQSDLVVTGVTAPETAIAGEPITIEWKIKNTGAFPAGGYMKEGIYLSLDTLKDNNDILLTSREAVINLGAGIELTQSFTTQLKGASLRNYYVLVHTDVVNNFYESNDSNNVGYAIRPMKVDVLPLPINSSVTTSLLNDREKYYKITVDDNFTKETLLITLNGAAGNNANEIYLRHGTVPTRAVHDFAYGTAFSTAQEILVPELRKGTYYLLVYGKAGTGTTQDVQLAATIRNFEIRTVDAAKGGNTRSVTVKITGSKFVAGMEVNLLDETAGTKIMASAVKYVDQSSLYATFDLAGAGRGKYTVQVQNPAKQVARLVDGFEVVQGTDKIIVTHVSHPANTRPNTVIAMQIEFSNNGNVDIPLTTRALISRFKAPVGFSAGELVMEKHALHLELLNKREPLNVLRPGARATITVYAKASSRLRFSLIK